jgi:mRNA interferase MazF
MNCSRDDIVLLPIPFTDLSTHKVRPAVVIGFGTYPGDLFVVPVTSQLGNADFPLADWRIAGLNVPSGIKAQIATVESNLVRKIVGQISTADRAEEPIVIRLAIVEALGRSPKKKPPSGNIFAFFRSTNNNPLSEADLIAENLLTAALADRETASGMSVYWEITRVSDPRVCDMAAHALSDRWPEKYAFRWSASPAERDEQIRKIRNTVRAERGQAPLPLF